ncbi:hypothetical protein AB0D16_28555 [Streptomyces sp. NPDC048161]|jgi:hypothetical protein
MTPDPLVALGDSKDRGPGAQALGSASWRVFCSAVREGVI